MFEQEYDFEPNYDAADYFDHVIFCKCDSELISFKLNEKYFCKDCVKTELKFLINTDQKIKLETLCV
jgi:hypothetical protein